MEYVLYVLIGFIASVSGGFWGLGGGWMIVPALLLLNVDIQTVAAASLFQMAISSSWTVFRQFPGIGWKKGGWGWNVALPFCMASFLSGFSGEYVSSFMKETFKSELPHQIIFFCILICIFISIFKTKPASPDLEKDQVGGALMKSLIASTLGLFSGVISAVVGIGGGIIARPVMTSILSVPEKTTGMITRLIVLFTGISGTTSYLYSGQVDRHDVVSIGLLLAMGGIPGFVIGAKMHESSLRSGTELAAQRSFAIIVLLTMAGMICKVMDVVVLGRIIISISGVIICVFLGWISRKK